LLTGSIIDVITTAKHSLRYGAFFILT